MIGFFERTTINYMIYFFCSQVFHVDSNLETNIKHYNNTQCEYNHMNISESETPVRVVAKTCGCKEKNKTKITYEFVDSYHSLCLDKKDIIYAELNACERLLRYVTDKMDKSIVEAEITELKMALDLLT